MYDPRYSDKVDQNKWKVNNKINKATQTDIPSSLPILAENIP